MRTKKQKLVFESISKAVDYVIEDTTTGGIALSGLQGSPTPTQQASASSGVAPSPAKAKTTSTSNDQKTADIGTVNSVVNAHGGPLGRHEAGISDKDVGVKVILPKSPGIKKGK